MFPLLAWATVVIGATLLTPLGFFGFILLPLWLVTSGVWLTFRDRAALRPAATVPADRSASPLADMNGLQRVLERWSVASGGVLGKPKGSALAGSVGTNSGVRELEPLTRAGSRPTSAR